MKNYTVEINIDGFYMWSGEAESPEDAAQQALDAAGEADFGDLENIDYELSSIDEE